jgi:hypothetical protein
VRGSPTTVYRIGTARVALACDECRAGRHLNEPAVYGARLDDGVRVPEN